MNRMRSNLDWLNELRGVTGTEAQQHALNDLAHFLYIVAYNYLVGRQHNASVPAIHHYTAHALAALAQDYVQDVLFKLTEKNFARLNQYNGSGTFTSWTASIMRHHIAGFLRRSFYAYTQEELSALLPFPIAELDLETIAALQEVLQALVVCINSLTERRRTAFIGCVVEGKTAKTVAADIGNSEGAVNLLVMNAKRDLRECMISKGFGPDVLDLFSP